jgi:hypothetical protein
MRHSRRPAALLVYAAQALLAGLVGMAGCNLVTGADGIELEGSDSAAAPPTGGGGTTSSGTNGGTGGTEVGGAGTGGAASSPCSGVDCGAYGSCVDVGGEAACDCQSGYHAEGLACVEDPPPGPCDGVVCGAHAACDAGICACDAGFEGDPDAGCTAIDPTEATVRQELVDIATAELGYCEGVDDRPYMSYQPGLWCYDFVAWVYQQSSYSLPSPLSLPKYYTGSLPDWWRPEPGDLIKFNIQHFGMVASVSADGQVITTIEGNVNLCVMSRTTSDASVEYYGTLDSVF